MGTDIHMYVERLVAPAPTSRSAAVALEIAPPTRVGWERVNCEVWDGRSYVTFAVLANVRNGYGFAGCKTHTPVNPIAMPRGVPVDVGSWYDEDSSGFDHTPTWLLLSEVLAYDWSREIVRTGVVPLADQDVRTRFNEKESLERMQREGRSKPENWSGGIMGPKITTVGYTEGVALLVDPSLRVADTIYYVSVEWREALSETCAPFLAWARSLTSLGTIDQIRLVFWFDS